MIISLMPPHFLPPSKLNPPNVSGFPFILDNRWSYHIDHRVYLFMSSCPPPTPHTSLILFLLPTGHLHNTLSLESLFPWFSPTYISYLSARISFWYLSKSFPNQWTLPPYTFVTLLYIHRTVYFLQKTYVSQFTIYYGWMLVDVHFPHSKINFTRIGNI